MKRTSLAQVLLLSLAVLAGRCTFCSSSEIKDEPSLASLIAGIDQLSSALENYEASCPQGDLSEGLEKSLTWSEIHFKRLLNMTEELEEQVENATKKTEEFLASGYAVLPTSAPEGCAGYFKEVAGGCFWIHQSPGRNWTDARKRCQREGSDLATPENIPAVISYLQRELGRTWTPVWLGGRITGSRNFRRIDTDEEESVPYSSWYYNRNGGSCASFHGGKGHQVSSWDCSDEGYFLCEKKI